MRTLELRDGRRITPNVRMVSSGVLSQFVSWFSAGVGLGVVLFVAFTILSALDHSADEVQGAAEPAYVSRPVAIVQKGLDDYRIIRERNRFVVDLADHFSRIVNRVVR